MAPTSRKYDIVVFGSTGFTGLLVAKYLYQNAPKSVKWAIAGRNADKLVKVRKTVATSEQHAEEIDIINADASDSKSLVALTAQTKVVITTVGPYSAYGEPLVSACVQTGTDYVDLTGEPWFVRNMINKYHEEAQKKGVMIVHSCGFDSIPSDLGTLLVVNHIREKYNCSTKSVSVCYGKVKGGASGGTLQSGLAAFKLPTSELLKLQDEFYLNDQVKGPKNPHHAFPVYKNKAFGWQGAFIMATANSKIVRRSSELRGDYGTQFTYSETQTYPNVVVAAIATLAIQFFGVMAFIHSLLPAKFNSKLLSLHNRVLPAPGTGPSQKLMDEGFWKSGIIAESTEGHCVKGYCNSFHNDPGYKGTAKMISESALCLALNRDKCFGKGGVLTPASAMGTPLIERLRKVGVEFGIDRENATGVSTSS